MYMPPHMRRRQLSSAAFACVDYRVVREITGSADRVSHRPETRDCARLHNSQPDYG